MPRGSFFAETSGNYPGGVFTLQYDGSGCSSGVIKSVSFYYNMYGKDTGQLSIKVRDVGRYRGHEAGQGQRQ